jgi:hypothetical protein
LVLSFSRVSTPYPAQLHLCSAFVWALASALGGPRRRQALGGAVDAGGTKGPSGNDRLTVISSGGDGARDGGGGTSGDLIAKAIGRSGVSRTVVTPSSSSSLPSSSSLLGVTAVLSFLTLVLCVSRILRSNAAISAPLKPRAFVRQWVFFLRN